MAVKTDKSGENVVINEKQLQELIKGNTFLGDEFWRGNRMRIKQWVGPEKSSAGWHYIYIFYTSSKTPLQFDDARIQVEKNIR